jgi:hypothetical protein
MRGELKMAGDFHALLQVLPATRGDAHRSELARALAGVV